jgi:ring-1,2-phenylacetyl-CoA epoxidase subunit PaaB
VTVYEVFRRERKGQPFQHAGSLPAPDASFAEVYAREQYGRRGESVALWVVPREVIHEIDEFVDELERNYHRVDGYSLKTKLAAARQRADTSGGASSATRPDPPAEPGSARREPNGG